LLKGGRSWAAPWETRIKHPQHSAELCILSTQTPRVHCTNTKILWPQDSKLFSLGKIMHTSIISLDVF
jgi:hypothetical protein